MPSSRPTRTNTTASASPAGSGRSTTTCSMGDLWTMRHAIEGWRADTQRAGVQLRARPLIRGSSHPALLRLLAVIPPALADGMARVEGALAGRAVPATGGRLLGE